MLTTARSGLPRAGLGVALALGLLAAWAIAAPYTCLALVVPAGLLAVLVAGALAPVLAYRRHRAGFYFPRDGLLYRIAGGALLAVPGLTLSALLYAASLAAFAALGGFAERASLALCAAVSTLALPWCSHRLAPRVSPMAHAFFVKRLLAWSGFLVALPTYLALALNSPVPDYLDPRSLAGTIDSASATVASRCGFTNFALKLCRELEAVQWFFMVTGSAQLPTAAWRALGWGLFLLYSGLALMGMGRCCAEIAGFLCRLDGSAGEAGRAAG
jgi:hypothetical protein